MKLDADKSKISEDEIVDWVLTSLERIVRGVTEAEFASINYIIILSVSAQASSMQVTVALNVLTY